MTASPAVQQDAKPMDAVAAYHASKPKPAASLFEAFANTAMALQQFGVERIRVVGLSKGCDERPVSGFDPLDPDVRVVTEHEFMRDFVFLSRPCIILDAIEDWPAMKKWRHDHYVFDLDGHLPLVEQRSTSSDEGDQGEVEEDMGDNDSSVAETQEAAVGEEKAAVGGAPKMEREMEKGKGTREPRPLGPKRFTIALTPNGRADAVTYVLYDTRDVPAEDVDDVYKGPVALKTLTALKDHPLITEKDRADAGTMAHLRLEKIFMYAAEVKLTLPELYTMLARGPKNVVPTPVFIDMRLYKSAEWDQHGATGSDASSSSAPASGPTPVIAYAQLQNNCLNTEFAHLHTDILTNVEEFGTRVFGEKPEAANVWLGIPASVSSMHQDWVENLYPVVRGVKEFILIPPWEGVFVPKPDIPSAAFALEKRRTDPSSLTFAFQPYPKKDGTVVPWMDLDITADMIEQENGAEAVLKELNERIEDCESRKQPLRLPGAAHGDAGRGNVSAAAEERERVERKKAKAVHPLVATVRPGETLYLPAMWLHRVAQRGDETDIRARARHHAEHAKKPWAGGMERESADHAGTPPLPLIAAVNYWYSMNFSNPSAVMLQEFGLLL